MPRIQNILISFGAFWLSLWVTRMVGGPPDRIINMVIRDETVLSALPLGVISSMGRTLAAVLAGILVTVIIADRKSELWALLVAALSVIDAPVRHHWGPPATGWDHLWQSVDLVFPALACIAAAFITARLRRNRSNIERVTDEWPGL